MEKQIGAVDDRINRHHDDLRNLESDLDESYLQKIKVIFFLLFRNKNLNKVI